MKRVAIIGVKGFPAIGGSARANENLIRYLKDKYSLTFYVLDSHQAKNYRSKADFVIIKSHKNQKMSVLLYYWKSLIHCLFKGRYDLVHVNNYGGGLIIPFLKAKYTVISTLRGVLGQSDLKFGYFPNLYFKMAERALLEYSDYVVSVSKPDVDYCRKFTDKEIHWIPNGIDLNQEPPDSNVKRPDYILFAAARIYETKGCHTFLEALKLIAYSREVLIIGDVEQRAEYKKRIMDLAVVLRAKFIPLVTEKKRLLGYVKKAKLFVFPSLSEGLSNMLLEVASLKTPLICSDIPSNKSVFREHETLFFKVGDPVDLGKKVRWALANEHAMHVKAKNAYDRLSKSFCWPRVAQAYDQLYQEALVEGDREIRMNSHSQNSFGSKAHRNNPLRT